jgi:tetratricopeptide (TPR) repeat protein
MQVADALRDPAITRADAPPDLWLARESIDNAMRDGEDVSGPLKEALRQYPSDRPLLLFSAVAAAFRGREPQALDMLETLCRQDQDACPALLYVGSELRRKRSAAAAERFVKKAVALRADWPAALQMHGDLLFELKEYQAALNRYEELGRFGTSVSLQFSRADCLLALDRREDARTQYESALVLHEQMPGRRLSDHDRASLTRLAKLYREQGSPDRATRVERLLGMH